MYRNGKLLASAAHATGAVAVNGNWAIGARGTGTERFFQGAIDEVRIYSRALDAGEIGVLAGTNSLDAKWNCKGEVLSKKARFTDDMTDVIGNVVGNDGRATR